MTLSESELHGPPWPPSADEHAATAESAPVLATGHLHPGMLLLRLFDGIRGLFLPVLITLFVPDLFYFAVIAGVWFLLSMGYALARYLTFQYTLTPNELITREGILHRQERRIPVNRIQDLSFESTILRRVLGLVVVSVETASGSGAEATLDSLGRYRAEQLREQLYFVRHGRRAADAPEIAVPQESLLFKVAAGELMLRGLTDMRLTFVAVILGSLWQFSGELGFDFGERIVEGSIAWLKGFSWAMVALIAIAAVFVMVLGSMVVSMLGNVMLFHDFNLTLRDEVIHRRYGLLTTRAATLPLRKIQRVLLEQNLMRRLLRVVAVRADSAGSGMNDSEESKTGRDIVVPLAKSYRAEALVPWLLPGFTFSGLEWQPVSRRLVARVMLKGVVWSLVLLLASVWFIGAWSALSLLAIPIGWVIGRLKWSNLAYAVTHDHAAIREGILGRYRAAVPFRKIQAVTLRAGPIERLFGLAQLTVYVAGGSPTFMPDLTRADAERLRERLAREAAASPFVW